MCWDSHSEFTHSHLNLRHSPTDPQTSVFTFAVVVVLYFRAGCTALLSAILSDSLPCLICYHDARCYTYAHSAFWSFWLYGKIQMYLLPKRYRQFFSRIPHDQICGICHCLSNVPQLRDGQTTFFLFPCGVLGGWRLLPILSHGHFAR